MTQFLQAADEWDLERLYQNLADAKRQFAPHKQQEGFTYVELADFNREQIAAFARNWFVALFPNNQERGEALSSQFIETLNSLENQQIRELAVTPILLNLTCLVFGNRARFPSNRAKLYDHRSRIIGNLRICTMVES